MSLKINVHRTFREPVTVQLDDDGKTVKGTFHAVFRILPTDEMDALRDLPALEPVLVRVEGLTLLDDDGNELTGDAHTQAARLDPVLALAMQRVYREAIRKKSGLAA